MTFTTWERLPMSFADEGILNQPPPKSLCILWCRMTMGQDHVFFPSCGAYPSICSPSHPEFPMGRFYVEHVGPCLPIFPCLDWGGPGLGGPAPGPLGGFVGGGLGRGAEAAALPAGGPAVGGRCGRSSERRRKAKRGWGGVVDFFFLLFFGGGGWSFCLSFFFFGVWGTCSQLAHFRLNSFGPKPILAHVFFFLFLEGRSKLQTRQTSYARSVGSKVHLAP